MGVEGRFSEAGGAQGRWLSPPGSELRRAADVGASCDLAAWRRWTEEKEAIIYGNGAEKEAKEGRCFRQRSLRFSTGKG